MGKYIKLGRGEINLDLLNLPKNEFIKFFDGEFGNAIFAGVKDREVVLSELYDKYNVANIKTDINTNIQLKPDNKCNGNTKKDVKPKSGTSKTGGGKSK